MWAATWGDSLCVSAEHVTQMLSRNKLACAVMGLIGSYFSAVQKLFVSCLTAGVSALIMQSLYANNPAVNSIALSIALVFVMSLAVSSLPSIVMSTSMDTLFVCFLMDQDLANKDPNQMFASSALKKAVYQMLTSAVTTSSTNNTHPTVTPLSASTSVQSVPSKDNMLPTNHV